MKNKKTTKYIVFSVILFAVAISVAYAYYAIGATNNFGSKTIGTKMNCLNITYSETNVINLNNNSLNYPITDEYVLANLTPVTVTVTNNCTNNNESVNYALTFTSLSENTGYIPDSKIRIAVKRQLGSNAEAMFKTADYVSNLNPLTSGPTYNMLISDLANRNTIKDFTNKTNYIIDKNKIADNTTNIYKIYLWIDQYEGDTTHTGLNDNTTMNMNYKAALSLVLNAEEKPTGPITIQLSNYNKTYNSQNINCTTGDNVYFNTKYQGMVFNNVGDSLSTCTLSSTNNTYSNEVLNNTSSYPYYLKNKVISEATDETSDTVTNSTSVTLNAGYRYEGTNPNNYIWFNNEMWRIIGVVPVCTSENCATKEDLVKIIRKDSIGSIAYDAKSTGYAGAWGSNTLFTLLNTKYWGKADATDTETCYGHQNTAKTKCDYRVVGIDANNYYGNMVKQNIYWNTGASTSSTNAKTVYENETKVQTVTGSIGLMSASDYGYGSNAGTRGNLSKYNTSAISLANWLYTNDYEWTTTQDTTASRVLGVYSGGNVGNAGVSFYGNAARPVLYLKDSVYVVSGNGTESSPYQVAIGS